MKSAARGLSLFFYIIQPPRFQKRGFLPSNGSDRTPLALLFNHLSVLAMARVLAPEATTC